MNNEERPGIGFWIVTSGREYEIAIAEVCKLLGYDVVLTPESNDQGVDVVLTTPKGKIAIQCKLYTSNPVGNEAVQQVYAGMSYYDCTEAWVVSNNVYTDSAIVLAKKIGVSLLNHNEMIKKLAFWKTALPELGSGLDRRGTTCMEIKRRALMGDVNAFLPYGRYLYESGENPELGLTYIRRAARNCRKDAKDYLSLHT